MTYLCDVCRLAIVGDDIANMHTNDETGEDCHEACCPTCNREEPEEVKP